MASGILGIGVSGLQAAQLGLATTSHNIANASTPGYSRQELVQGAQAPHVTGAGSIGQGVAAETIRRQFDAFLNRMVVSAEAQGAALDTLSAQLQSIDNLLADANAGLSPALQDFFNAVHDLANDPASMVPRQSLLAAAQSLVSRFTLLDQRFSELREGVNRQIESTVGQVNVYTTEIARLNEQIASTEAASHQPANDLRDRRDQLVLELNRSVGARVVEQGPAYNVFIGNGVPVVLGGNSYALATLVSPVDAGRTQVGVATPGGTVAVQESLLQGGSLGGLIAFRSQSLDPARNAVGRIATVLAGTVNDQLALGQDRNGQPGSVLFNVAAPLLSASSANAGTAQLAAAWSDYGALTTSDYRIDFDGANYVVTRLADNAQQSFAALPAAVDGVSISLAAGTPSAGDVFLLRPTAGGAAGISVAMSDPARVAAAAPIRTGAAGANTGSGRISAGTVNAPPPPDPNLAQTVTITFTGAGTFDVTGAGTGNPTGVAYTPGAAINYNGWTVTIDGTPAAGDIFTVAANSGGVSDGRNALLIAGLQLTNTIGAGTATYQSAYSQLVARVGNDARQADTGASAQRSYLGQTRTERESVSGVNLDEEAANLVRYQQAYQASARTIQVATRLFQDLLDMLN